MTVGALTAGPGDDPLAIHHPDQLARKRTVAIIGASTDRSKFGNKAVRAYESEGWEVWPVHPSAAAIEGHAAYASVSALPDLPDRASLYLKEEPALRVLDDLAALESTYGRKIQDVYLNPGVGRKVVREHADELGLNRVSRCSIRAIGRLPKEFPAE